MKTTAKFLLLILAAGSGLLLQTCKKTPSEQVFAGTSRVRGIVLYKNAVSNLLDTAMTAQLTLEKGADKTTDYSLVLTNGAFDISPLNSGDYTFTITFYHPVPGSTKSILYQIKSPSFHLNDGQFIDRDTIVLQPALTASPTLQLKVVDNTGSIVPNAPVFLYTDAGTLAQNRRTGSGSTKSAVTNAYGYILVDNLQTNLNYYGASFVVRGGDTVSNIGTDSQPVLAAPLSATALNFATITITPDAYYSLEVTVIDQNGAQIPNVNVSIYSDKNLLAKNRFTGTGSLASLVTNLTGTVNFKGLQKLAYYISASKAIGTDMLSNQAIDQTATNILKANDPNLTTITIK